MHFCLQLDELKPISHEEFDCLNWLPMTYRFKQYSMLIQLFLKTLFKIVFVFDYSFLKFSYSSIDFN